MGKAALDNKGAIFKALAGVMAVLKDTLREVGGGRSGRKDAGREAREGTPRWDGGCGAVEGGMLLGFCSGLSASAVAPHSTYSP